MESHNLNTNRNDGGLLVEVQLSLGWLFCQLWLVFFCHLVIALWLDSRSVSLGICVFSHILFVAPEGFPLANENLPHRGDCALLLQRQTAPKSSILEAYRFIPMLMSTQEQFWRFLFLWYQDVSGMLFCHLRCVCIRDWTDAHMVLQRTYQF